LGGGSLSVWHRESRGAPRAGARGSRAVGPGYHAEPAVVRAGQCAGVALVRAAYGRGGSLLSGWAEIAPDRGFPGVSPGLHGETTARIQGQVELQPGGPATCDTPALRHGLGGWACLCATRVS